MSPELQEFYNDYAAWLDAGAPHCTPYNRRYGLCYAIHIFTRAKFETLTAAAPLRQSLIVEMGNQFIKAFACDDGFPELHAVYPFGNMADYHAQEASMTAHLNPKRIAWVRSQTAQLTKENV